MTIQEIKRLRETKDKVEFKEAKRNFNFDGGSHADPSERRKCVLGYVVALANEGGGLLIMGVKEKKVLPHEIVGTTFAEGKIGALEDTIYERLSFRVRIEELFDNEKRVLVFNIPSRPIGSTLKFEGVSLMRIGDSLHVMSDYEYARILSENEPDFSATICEGLTFEDLDPEAITVMKERYAIKQENPAFKTLPDMQILSDLELTEKGKLNYAALLLLGTRKSLRKYLPNAAVTIEYRLNHAMIPYTARQEFQEPIFTLIDKIWAYINQPASNPLLHIRDKFNIYDIKSFNEEVVRKAVINACIHRSYKYTDDTQVDFRLKAKIMDDAFYMFINKIQGDRIDKLNVFDLLTLDKVRRGISMDLPETSVEKLQREGLIKSQSSADKKYVLCDLYHEIANQPAYIKEYRARDLQIVAGCFEKSKEVSMKEFVDVFDNQLSREQVRYLISKLEENQLIERLGGGRSIKYRLNKNRSIENSVFEYFNEVLSE